MRLCSCCRLWYCWQLFVIPMVFAVTDTDRQTWNTIHNV